MCLCGLQTGGHSLVTSTWFRFNFDWWLGCSWKSLTSSLNYGKQFNKKLIGQLEEPINQKCRRNNGNVWWTHGSSGKVRSRFPEKHTTKRPQRIKNLSNTCKEKKKNLRSCERSSIIRTIKYVGIPNERKIIPRTSFRISATNSTNYWKIYSVRVWF